MIETVCKEIDSLVNNTSLWKDEGYEEPNEQDFNLAKTFISAFISYMNRRGYEISNPYVSNGSGGGVSFEWHDRKADKALYFDVEEQEIEYTKLHLKSSGTFTERRELQLDNYEQVWDWFCTKEKG